jgi:D-alanyl-D-alanine carboxypeptidase (penicillin-binding protein 5/6)
VYASAARSWLEKHGVPGVTVVEPTGIDPRNTASAASLLVLMEKAVANPVIAEILAKPTTDLPGAGTITTTNGMLADAGVIGGKTGTLRADHNLVAAKNVMIGETPVRLYGAVLGQADDAGRVEALRALFAQIEAELQTEPSVPAGTTVGVIDTEWGEHIEVKTASDAAVVLWNGITGTVSTDLSLGDDRDEGDEVGALSVKGPLNGSTVDVVLADEIEPPTPWWRLTHPLELFGLAG